MTLENITVSLELAKELKNSGYPQESLFVWTNYNKLVLKKRIYECNYEPALHGGSPLTAAPTASELLEQLPSSHTFQYEDRKYGWADWKLYKIEDAHDNLLGWTINIGRGNYGEQILWEEEAETSANALAKMWLYLKEEDLL